MTARGGGGGGGSGGRDKKKEKGSADKKGSGKTSYEEEYERAFAEATKALEAMNSCRMKGVSLTKAFSKDYHAMD